MVLQEDPEESIVSCACISDGPLAMGFGPFPVKHFPKLKSSIPLNQQLQRELVDEILETGGFIEGYEGIGLDRPCFSQMSHRGGFN